MAHDNAEGGIATPEAAAPPATSERPMLETFDMSIVNPNVTGWDYLKQFPPEVEAVAHDYLHGSVPPTGSAPNADSRIYLG